MLQAKTLTLDIETAPLIAMVWELGKQYVSKDQVIQDWHIMSFSAKWLDDPASKLIYMETRDGDDKPLLKKLRELFNEADIVVTQNGKKFDEPKIRARMMLAGLKPYSPFQHYDTFIENKDKSFTSHSLEYLTDKFCTKYKKLKHKLFAGLSLWKECLGIKITFQPNPKAWQEMRKYNNWDVLSTEELFINTRAWSTKKAPKVYEVTNFEMECGTCGYNGKMIEGKIRKAKKYSYRQHICPECGVFQPGEVIKPKKDAA